MILQSSKLPSRAAKVIAAALIAATVGAIGAGTASAEAYKYDYRDGHWLKWDERDRHWVRSKRGPPRHSGYYNYPAPRRHWNDGYHYQPYSYYYPRGGGYYHYHSAR